MRRLVIALAIAAGACASKTVPLPNESATRFQDFVEPTIPQAFTGNPAAIASQQRGWRFLQAGDFRNADREFQLALRAAPQFYPAETSLGYLELARKDAKAALPHFEKALLDNGRYVPALVGGGQAFLALGRDRDALFAFQSAVAVDPSLSDIRRRVDVLQFRGVERELAAARQAVKDGKLDDAAKAFGTAIASSPDSGFLYRELADVEIKRGNDEQALQDLEKAIALDAGDTAAMVQIGDVLASRGDFDGAARWYGEAVVIDPSDAVEAKLDAARVRAEAEHLPAEYKAIEGDAQLTRGDLAGLIGIRLPALVQPSRQRTTVVVSDVRNHWASTWILAVVRAGIMDAFANHTFQPRAVLRRSDLAVAMSRLLTRVAGPSSVRGRNWQAARLKFADLAPTHLAYPAASMAVAAGVMTADPDNKFQPSRIVTGAEALAAVAHIEALAADERK
ncbi:MAG TPA: S-layer homology domain-containing protein [Vicinamibacterales bacterium]|nr:S-layer homology domain-containing protein [Vicinamibacterales bacterium]